MVHADAEDAETRSGQPTAELPEAKPKWLCDECRKIVTEYLTAPNPFDETDWISGCPHCKSVNCLTKACQVEGCRFEATNGTVGGYGFRYFYACTKHFPGRDAIT